MVETAPVMRSIQIIPEDIIVQSAEELGPDSTYSKMLKVAEQWREAECTPMFLYDAYNNMLYCVSKETFNKKLH